LKLKRFIKGLYQTEDSIFVLQTGLKVTAIGLFNMLFSFFLLFALLKVNSIFFEANGYPGSNELREAYYDFITGRLYSYGFVPVLYLGVLFLMGVFIAKKMLRPFIAIAEYSEKSLLDKNVAYEVDGFSDFKLLTRFSEYFFSYVNLSRSENKLIKHIVPPQYTKVHGPVFDRVYFFHFFLIVTIICIYTLALMNFITADLYENLVKLAISTLKANDRSIRHFILQQSELFEMATLLSMTTTIILFLILSLHLYAQVSGAAFGVFSTMRSFIKGNFSTRVHLIGYAYVRPYTRSLNKLLDYLQKNYNNKTNE
jgi:hypothetical protein